MNALSTHAMKILPVLLLVPCLSLAAEPPFPVEDHSGYVQCRKGGGTQQACEPYLSKCGAGQPRMPCVLQRGAAESQLTAARLKERDKKR